MVASRHSPGSGSRILTSRFVSGIAPDHRDVGDRGDHGGGDAGLPHGGQHAPVHIASAARPAGVRVHIDDHGRQIADRRRMAIGHAVVSIYKGLAPPERRGSSPGPADLASGLPDAHVAALRHQESQDHGRRERRQADHDPRAGGFCPDARGRPAGGGDPGHDHAACAAGGDDRRAGQTVPRIHPGA